MSSPVPNIRQQLELAEDSGVKLEWVSGIPTWEAFPGPRHQRKVVSILNAIRNAQDSGSGCKCEALPDVYILFPDGSLKRPDIAIFCNPPDDGDESTTVVPDAVIEIISKGYEDKDLKIGAPFYLSQGVKDIVVVDPRTSEVWHFSDGSLNAYTSPAELNLLCGCMVTV